MSLSTEIIDNFFTRNVIGNLRQTQEDCSGMAETPNGDVFVVCDGVGDNADGDKASSIAVDAIIEFFMKGKYDNVPQAINDALQYANEKILSYASVDGEYAGMSTTACVLLLQDKNAFIAHVGDSRIYLYLGKEKELHRLTKDHSYVQSMIDAGEITDDEAESHPRKNIILNALGNDAEVNPTIDMLQPKNGDVFLLCTVGLNGMIPDHIIENTLNQDDSLGQKGEMLVELAMQGKNGHQGRPDNCTLQLIKIDNSPWERSEFTSYSQKKQNESEMPSRQESDDEISSEDNGDKKTKSLLEKILYVIIPLLIIVSCLVFINKEKKENKSLVQESKVETKVSQEEAVIQDSLFLYDEMPAGPEAEDVQAKEPEPEIMTEPEPIKNIEQLSKPKTIYTKNVSFGITKAVETDAEYIISYKVRKGDNISEICQMFGCVQSDFRKWNNLKNNNIGAGMVYIVKPQRKNMQCKVYAVKRNEILANIAKRNKVKMDDLIAWNGLKNPNSIQPGQKLIMIVKK